jgi:hypothetical protein
MPECLLSRLALKIVLMTGKRQEVNRRGPGGFRHQRLEKLKGKREEGFGDFTFCHIILFFYAELLKYNKIYQIYEQ